MATAEAQDEMVTARQAAESLGIARSNIGAKIRLGHLVGIKEEAGKGEWSIYKASLAKEMKRTGRIDVQEEIKLLGQRFAALEEGVGERLRIMEAYINESDFYARSADERPEFSGAPQDEDSGPEPVTPEPSGPEPVVAPPPGVTVLEFLTRVGGYLEQPGHWAKGSEALAPPTEQGGAHRPVAWDDKGAVAYSLPGCIQAHARYVPPEVAGEAVKRIEAALAAWWGAEYPNFPVPRLMEFNDAVSGTQLLQVISDARGTPV